MYIKGNFGALIFQGGMVWFRLSTGILGNHLVYFCESITILLKKSNVFIKFLVVVIDLDTLSV